MRRAILQMTDLFLVELLKPFTHGACRTFEVKKNALPDDAKPVGCVDMGNGVLGVVIESDSFEDVELGKQTPILELPVIETRHWFTRLTE